MSNGTGTDGASATRTDKDAPAAERTTTGVENSERLNGGNRPPPAGKDAELETF